MKKKICLLLAAVLLLGAAGCGDGAWTAPARAKEYGYFCFPGFDWDAPEEEVLDALGLAKEDFKVGESRDKHDTAAGELESVQAVYSGGRADFLGGKAEFRVLFENAMAVSEVPGVQSLSWAYPGEEITREAFDERCKKLEELIAAQGVEVETGEPAPVGADGEITFRIRSRATLDQLPEEARRKYAEVYRRGAELLETEKTGLQIPDDPLSTDSRPLSEATLRWEKDKETGKMACSGSMRGNPMMFLTFLSAEADTEDTH